METTKTVWYFSAPWCNPCKTMGPLLDLIMKDRKDVNVVKIDVEKTPELAKKYDVMNLPTLLRFKDNGSQERLVGLVSRDKILNFLDA